MQNNDKNADKYSNTVWFLAVIAIMAFTLAILFLPGQIKLNSVSAFPTPTTNRVLLDGQFLQALAESKNGDLKNARIRLEHILSQNPEYPGAALFLTNISPTLNAVTTSQAGKSASPSMSPPEETDPRSRMHVIATLMPMNSPAENQVSAPEEMITPRITATPQDLDLQNDEVIKEFVRKSHPGVCPAINLVENPEPDFMPPPPAVTVSEVAAFPDTRSYYVSEIADNSDGTLRAAIACTGERCVDNVYVRNQQSGKAYIVNFGAEQGRPLQWLVWLNHDTFLIFQSFSPHTGLVAAIDFAHEKFVHYGMGFECMADKPEEP